MNIDVSIYFNSFDQISNDLEDKENKCNDNTDEH